MAFENLYRKGIPSVELARKLKYNLPFIKIDVPFERTYLDEEGNPKLDVKLPNFLVDSDKPNIHTYGSVRLYDLFNEIANVYWDAYTNPRIHNVKKIEKIKEECRKKKRKENLLSWQSIWIKKKPEVYITAIKKAKDVLSSNTYKLFKTQILDFMKNFTEKVIEYDESKRNQHDIFASSSILNVPFAALDSLMTKSYRSTINPKNEEEQECYDEIFKHKVIVPIIEKIYKDIQQTELIPSLFTNNIPYFSNPGENIILNGSNQNLVKRIVMLNTDLDERVFMKIQKNLTDFIEKNILSEQDTEFSQFYKFHELSKGSLDEILKDKGALYRIRNALFYDGKVIGESLSTFESDKEEYKKIAEKFRESEIKNLLNDCINFVEVK